MQDVTERWVVPDIRQHMHITGPSLSDCLRDVAGRVAEVAKDAGFAAARLHARWLFAAVDKVRTHGALFDDALFLVKGAHAIGTCHHAVLASDTLVFVDEDNSIGAFVRCPRGADGDTLWILAVLTLNRKIILLYIWKCSDRANAEDLVPVGAKLHIVFLFAGDHAGMASDAPV
jgi:hypothetical protein